MPFGHFNSMPKKHLPENQAFKTSLFHRFFVKMFDFVAPSATAFRYPFCILPCLYSPFPGHLPTLPRHSIPFIFRSLHCHVFPSLFFSTLCIITQGGVPPLFFHPTILFSIAYLKNKPCKTPFLCHFITPKTTLLCHHGRPNRCSSPPRLLTHGIRCDRSVRAIPLHFRYFANTVGRGGAAPPLLTSFRIRGTFVPPLRTSQ